jgi:hypothetical protein
MRHKAVVLHTKRCVVMMCLSLQVAAPADRTIQDSARGDAGVAQHDLHAHVSDAEELCTAPTARQWLAPPCPPQAQPADAARIEAARLTQPAEVEDSDDFAGTIAVRADTLAALVQRLDRLEMAASTASDGARQVRASHLGCTYCSTDLIIDVLQGLLSQVLFVLHISESETQARALLTR